MTKARLTYFDNLKGLMITLVVIGHFIEPISGIVDEHHFIKSVYVFIYLFHMPVFIFVTGIFSKNTYVDGKYRADVPVFYFIISAILYTALVLENALATNELSFAINYLTSGGDVAWYVLAAAVYSLLDPVFSKFKATYAIGASIIVSVLAGLGESTSVLAISRVITFAPFFLMGFYSDPARIVQCMHHFSKNWFKIISIFALALCFVIFYIQGDHALVFLRQFFFGNQSYANALSISGLHLSVWSCLFLRLIYYPAVLIAGVGIALLIPIKEVAYFTRAGERSLQIYVLHPLIYYSVAWRHWVADLSASVSGLLFLLIVSAIAIFITFVLSQLKLPQLILSRMRSMIRTHLESNQAITNG